MSFSSTSKYVQLTPYLLMEYMYADEPQPESYFVNTGPTTVAYQKLVNGYISDDVQIFNPNSDYDITHNTQNNSVVQIGTNSFVTLDANLIIPFNDYSERLTNTNDLNVTFPSNLLVVYDTVRYHIRAGYNFNNLDGAILQIQLQDQDLSYVTLSQILLQKGTQQDYTFNPNPVTIGSNIYDKYFEIKIPNSLDMNNKYLAASSSFKDQTLASLISKSGNGFVYGAPIRVSIWQVQSTIDFEGYSRYESARVGTLSLEGEDPFSNIGATIKESEQGQFFEYFATDNEGFIEDFILFQNSIGNNYYISHKIEVLEQIGTAVIQTSSFESIQTTAYDSPNYYRPIVRNAAFSVSFTLRYTMSLINTVDQSSVIRISSYTSNNPAAWGLNIQPIQLSNFPQVQKIYNRVYDQPSINMTGNQLPQPKEILKFTNVFIQENYVTATSSNLTFSAGTLAESVGTTSVTAVGSGKLTLTISPFDNYFKFKFIKNVQNGTPSAIDLSDSGLFKLAFLDKAGNKTYVPALADLTIARPTLGEIAFKVDESTSGKISQFTDRRFFITNGGGATGSVSSTPATVVAAATTGTNAAAVPKTAAIVNMIAQMSNQSTSVLYWGYWKKNGETDVLVPPTTTIPPSSGSGINVIGTIGVVAPTRPPSLSRINPPAGQLVSIENPANLVSVVPATGITANIVSTGPATGITANIVSTGPATPTFTISGTTPTAILIPALSAQIQGYKATGWADQTIISYFLSPGKPGYQQYPGLTKAQFIEASQGILAPQSIDGLRGNEVGSTRPDRSILRGIVRGR
jgi:hypothetical protein